MNARARIEFLIAFMMLLAASPLAAQKNVIKTNLPGWTVLNYNIAYERVLAPKLSLQIYGSYLDPIHFNVHKYFFREATNFAVKPMVDGIFVTPELRYYLGTRQDAPEGFYASGFIRYFRYRVLTDYMYHRDSVTEVNASAKGWYSGLGIGATLGYQCVIKKHFVLDFFAGLGIGFGNVKIRVHDPILTPTDYEGVAEALGGINVHFPGFNVYYGTDVAGLSFPVSPIPLFRGGIMMGYAF